MNNSEPPYRVIQKTKLPFKPPFFYGWIIVGLSALTIFFSGPGQTYSVSIFIDSYISEFEWSRSAVSSMYSLGTLIAGLAMGFVGNKIDQWGHRLVTVIIASLFGIACLGMSLINSLGMLFFGFMSIRLLGQGSMSLSGTTLVPQWFIKKKGKALSIASLGGAIGMALLPPLNTWLIHNFGWRFGWQFWAILLICIMAPAAYFFIRNRPEEVNLHPDNILTSEKQREQPVKWSDEEHWTVSEAIHTKSFWLLLYCSMVPGAIVTGLMFHHISVMEQIGVTPMIAALVMSIMAITRLPFVLIAGPIADKVPTRYLLALSELLLLIAIIVILKANLFGMAILYGLLIGILIAFLTIARGVIWPDYFGRRYLGSIRGVTMIAGVIGSSLGPLPFGVAYDYFGGYQEILIISLIFPILAIFAALIASPPHK